MKIFLKNTLCALLCLAIVGNAACTTTHTLDASAEGLAAYNIREGDELQLHFADFTTKEITVTAVDESGIAGTDKNGEPVDAAFDDLDYIVFTSVDGGKTAKNAGKAVGIAALIAVVVAATGVAALSEGMSKQ